MFNYNTTYGTVLCFTTIQYMVRYHVLLQYNIWYGTMFYYNTIHVVPRLYYKYNQKALLAFIILSNVLYNYKQTPNPMLYYNTNKKYLLAFIM